ncbi:MAG TPA: hypothetical protein VMT95_00935 [Candidatus Binatia bacterium]|nr:hypothetical protein [Candidatus Binatia bacterium]
MLVRRLGGFHVVVDVRVIEDDAVHFAGLTMAAPYPGAIGLIEVAR